MESSHRRANGDHGHDRERESLAPYNADLLFLTLLEDWKRDGSINISPHDGFGMEFGGSRVAMAGSGVPFEFSE